MPIRTTMLAGFIIKTGATSSGRHYSVTTPDGEYFDGFSFIRVSDTYCPKWSAYVLFLACACSIFFGLSTLSENRAVRSTWTQAATASSQRSEPDGDYVNPANPSERKSSHEVRSQRIAALFLTGLGACFGIGGIVILLFGPFDRITIVADGMRWEGSRARGVQRVR